MGKTSIEWATDVWNPTSGCSKVSAGCKNCYAERIANRFWGERKFTDVQCHPERLEQPLHWKKPRRVFVDSMSDLFHPDVPYDFIASVWSQMIAASWHTFMVLTKRPDQMLKIVPTLFRTYPDDHIYTPPNVWLGVSVENQQAADERIPLLLQTPAAVRFVSVEPMLEKIDISIPLYQSYDGDNISWVICGCESCPGARPMELDWARSLRDQCQDAGVPIFLKQAVINGKLVKMPELDGKIWAEYPDRKDAEPCT